MYVCGYNKKHQLAEPSNYKECINPPIKSNLKISSLISYSIDYMHAVIVTQDWKAYAIGENTRPAISSTLPKKDLFDWTEVIIHDQKGQPCKVISAVCENYGTLYLVSSQDGTSNSLYFAEAMFESFFINIGNRNPKYLFGCSELAAAIDSEGGILFIMRLCRPENLIEPAFLPEGDNPIKVTFSNEFFYVLGSSGTVYKAKIMGSFKVSEIEVEKELEGKILLTLPRLQMMVSFLEKDIMNIVILDLNVVLDYLFSQKSNH